MYVPLHSTLLHLPPSDSTLSEDAAIRTRKPNNKILTPLQSVGDLDPDPLFRGMDPAPDPDPSVFS
jgi:hypothetical protein